MDQAPVAALAQSRLLAVEAGGWLGGQAARRLVVGCLALLTGCGGGQADTTPLTAGVRLVPVYRGLTDPTYLTALPGDDRVFIVEQAGRILIGRERDSTFATFLDIRDRVGSGGERGLLSMAFHPRFRENGRVFVNYTDRRGHTHVAEFRADTAATRADPASERRILFVRQPYANHNGGHVLFGPDGGLYVGMGDGGSAGDPGGRAQDPRSNLGKLLRITVDQSGIEPPPNQGPPRAIQPWALGLRNPWRFWFDEGLLYIADVGQNRWEEINVAPADSIVINYGWRTMEGAHCFINPACGKSGLYPPALEYGRADGCSIIGGVVYRGTRVPALAGHYLYSDYCSGWLKSFRYANGAVTERRVWDVPSPGPVLSFGLDSRREVYLLALNGTAYRIEPAR